jgi:hypothetical protein
MAEINLAELKQRTKNLRGMLIDKKEDLLRGASKKGTKEVTKFVEFVRLLVANLEEGRIKLSHR